MADGSGPHHRGVCLRTSPWTTAEERTLRAEYTAGGMMAARRALPHRSEQSIYNRAYKLRLKAPIVRPAGRRRYPHIDALDQGIAAIVAAGAEREQIERLAAHYNRPMFYITRRAAQLGCPIPMGMQAAAWSEAEFQLLDATASTTAKHASKEFAKAGFTRTPAAINHMRHMRGVERGIGGVLNAAGLATLLGCGPVLIRLAIRHKRLAAERHDGASGEVRWQIRERDVCAWLRDYPYAIDFAAVPRDSQPWLINVLSGKFSHD